MRTSFTDDPDRDFLAYDSEQADRLERLPKCARCGEPIQDDYGYEYEGEIYCEECFDWYIKDELRVPIAD